MMTEADVDRIITRANRMNDYAFHRYMEGDQLVEEPRTSVQELSAIIRHQQDRIRYLEGVLHGRDICFHKGSDMGL